MRRESRNIYVQQGEQLARHAQWQSKTRGGLGKITAPGSELLGRKDREENRGRMKRSR